MWSRVRSEIGRSGRIRDCRKRSVSWVPSCEGIRRVRAAPSLRKKRDLCESEAMCVGDFQQNSCDLSGLHACFTDLQDRGLNPKQTQSELSVIVCQWGKEPPDCDELLCKCVFFELSKSIPRPHFMWFGKLPHDLPWFQLAQHPACRWRGPVV